MRGAMSCLSAERPGVERWPVRAGPDAQCESSETEHRSRSQWASKRSGRGFRLRDKPESGAAGVRQFRGVEARTKEKRRPSESWRSHDAGGKRCRRKGETMEWRRGSRNDIETAVKHE
jgi:hypothetical protein